MMTTMMAVTDLAAVDRFGRELGAAEAAGGLGVSASGVVLFLIVGVVLFGALHGARYLVRVSTLARRRRATIETGLSILEVLIGVVYLLSAVPLVFQGRPEVSPYFAVLVIATALWVAWAAGRDLVHGVFFKAARVCRPGDVVEIGRVRGRVERLGYRYLTLVTSHGDEVVLPYGAVVGQTVVRAPVEEGAARYAFRLARPAGVAVPAVTRAVRLAAFNHPWASAAHEAEVALGDGDGLEVGVYALDPLYGPAIEASVRRAVAALPGGDSARVG